MNYYIAKTETLCEGEVITTMDFSENSRLSLDQQPSYCSSSSVQLQMQ